MSPSPSARARSSASSASGLRQVHARQDHHGHPSRHRGRIVFEGNDITHLRPDKSRAIRRRLQYSYQDPGASLDPRWKIRRSLHEPLVIHTDLSADAVNIGARHPGAVGLPETHLISTHTKSQAASSAVSAPPAS